MGYACVSFYIGQQVVCVDVNFSREPTWRSAVRKFPKLKDVYAIRDIRVEGDLVGLCFEEIINARANFSSGHVEAAFDSRKFRPLRRTSIEVFERLLAPVASKKRSRALEPI
jgi:hypothetical protein